MKSIITPVAFAAADGDHFCGIALGSRWCLTVAHPTGLDPSCKVRFWSGTDCSRCVEVERVIKHSSLDLALVRLSEDAPVRVARPLLRHDANVGQGCPVEIHVSYPGTPEKLECFTHYSIGASSTGALEYRLGPQNAKGHSGGVVTLDGQVIGVLYEREQNDPHCYAIPVAAARPFIDEHTSGCVEWTKAEPDQVVQEFLKDFRLFGGRFKWLEQLKPANESDRLHRSEILEWLADYAKHLGNWADFKPDSFDPDTALPFLHRLLVNYVRLAVREKAVEHLLSDAQTVTVLPAVDSGLAGIAYTFGRPAESLPGAAPTLKLHRTANGWVKPEGVVDPTLATLGIGLPETHRIQKEFWLQCTELGAFPMADGQELSDEHLGRLKEQLEVKRVVDGHITVIAVKDTPNASMLQVASDLEVGVLPFSGEQGGLFYCPDAKLRAVTLKCLHSLDRLQAGMKGHQ